MSHVTVCFVADQSPVPGGAGNYCDETDERGAFNVANLPPGRFTYRAGRAGYFASEPLAEGLPSMINLKGGDEIRDVKLRMQRAGVITGHVLYADGEPFSGASLTVRPLGATTATNDLGEYRFANLRPGEYSVSAQFQGQPRDRVADCDEFARRNRRLYVERSTGTPPPPIRVSSGQTAMAPDLVMIQATPRRVTGRIDWDEYPLPGSWFVHGADQTVQSRAADGTFSFCGVPPGDHTLEISAVVAGRTVAGEAKIHVAGEDLKDVEIIPEVSAIIRAGIDVEGDVHLDLSRVQIVGSYLSQDGLTPSPHNSAPQARPAPDGTFIIQDVYTGGYRFALANLPSGSYLKSVSLGGREFIDAALMIRAGEAIDGLIFTVSAKAGRVNGAVQDDAGNPVPDAFVWMQPDPLHTAGPEIHACNQTSDQLGAFTCANLAPGKYRVAAWRTFPEEPSGVQQTVSSAGVPIEVPESGDASVTVPLTKQ